jgi:hypothetical protein
MTSLLISTRGIAEESDKANGYKDRCQVVFKLLELLSIFSSGKAPLHSDSIETDPHVEFH